MKRTFVQYPRFFVFVNQTYAVAVKHRKWIFLQLKILAEFKPKLATTKGAKSFFPSIWKYTFEKLNTVFKLR